MLFTLFVFLDFSLCRNRHVARNKATHHAVYCSSKMNPVLDVLFKVRKTLHHILYS